MFLRCVRLRRGLPETPAAVAAATNLIAMIHSIILRCTALLLGTNKKPDVDGDEDTSPSARLLCCRLTAPNFPSVQEQAQAYT